MLFIFETQTENNRKPVPAWSIRSVYERTSFHRSVIEEVSDPELRSAYEHCRNITRRYAKTFYLATRFLPNQKQRSIFAIYGLCRYLDNLVDEAEDLIVANPVKRQEVEGTLADWKGKLQRTYDGGGEANPILLALSDVLKRHHIDISLPFELIDGVGMDLSKSRYETFEELYDYSYKVASVVGLMVSEIFGYDDKAALQHAVNLGIAMQLTNILRDVGEDLERDRIYLPAEDLVRFGVSEDDLFNRRVTGSFREMMRYQIDRARSYYESADKGIPMLSPDSQIPVRLARHNYARILDQIEANDYQVFTHRAYLSFTQKMAILPRVWWHTVRH